MKDKTELAPCPFCKKPAFESVGLIGCDNRFCVMRHAPLIEKHEWQNRPDLLRIKELEEKVGKLTDAARIGAKWLTWWLENQDCECEFSHTCGRTERQNELRAILELIEGPKDQT